MDSITQVVLGAACGEVVLGKKAGNRAMLWGGIGGTIPDLDILSYLFTDDMTALAWHRGFSHSFLFAVTAPLLFGWLVAQFYKSGLYTKKTYKSMAMFVWLFVLSGIAFAVNYIPISMEKGVSFPLMFFSIGVVIVFSVLLYRKYYDRQLEEIDIHWKDWALLFFWSIFTHPLLDCCTSYGTQIFQPFSDYRVAFNNISVADPLYTSPFLICILIAAFYLRHHPRRRWFTWSGIALSTAYLTFTFYHKIVVDDKFEQSLQRDGIAYERYTTAPTILNNILWHGVAESDSFYHHGLYSFWDKEQLFSQIEKVPKNHHFIKDHYEDEDIQTLVWFTNGYYSISRRKDGHLQLNDNRFGSRSGTYKDNDGWVFNFILKEENGVLNAEENRVVPQDGELQRLFARMMGEETK